MPPRARRADVAARRAEVLRLRTEQRPTAEIAAKLGITPNQVRVDYHRALEAYSAEQHATAGLAVARELAKLDQLEHVVYEVLRRQHWTVSNGKLIYHGDKPLEDDAPVLAAADRLVKIAQRRARLLGLDAPVEVRVSSEVDAAIMALSAQIGALPPAPSGVT